MHFFRTDPAWKNNNNTNSSSSSNNNNQTQRSPPPTLSNNTSDTHEGSDDDQVLYYSQLASGSSESSTELLLDEPSTSLIRKDSDADDNAGPMQWPRYETPRAPTSAGRHIPRPSTPKRTNSTGSRAQAQQQQQQQLDEHYQLEQQYKQAEQRQQATPSSSEAAAPQPVFSTSMPPPPPQMLQDDETIINSALAEAWFARRREHRMQQMLMYNPPPQQQQRFQQQQPATPEGLSYDPRTGGFQRGPAPQHAVAPYHHPHQQQQHYAPYMGNPNQTMMMGPVDVDTGGVLENSGPPTATAIALRNPFVEDGAPSTPQIHPHYVAAANMQAQYDDSVTVVSKPNSLASYPSVTPSETTQVISNVAYPQLPKNQYSNSSYAASSSTAYIPSATSTPPGDSSGPSDDDEENNGDGNNKNGASKGFCACCSSGGDRNSCKGFLDIRTYHGKLAILLVTILVLAIATMAVSASMTFQSRKANQSSNQNQNAGTEPTAPTSAPVQSPLGAIPTLAPTRLGPQKAPSSLAPVPAPVTQGPTLGPTTAAPTSSPVAVTPSPVAMQPQTNHPSSAPSDVHSSRPSVVPSSSPSSMPVTDMPSSVPSVAPSRGATPEPTNFPTAQPTPAPSSLPTGKPITIVPTSQPTVRPTQSLEDFILPKVTTIEGPASGSNFGTSVALSRNGQVLAVGAPDHAQRTGQVRVLAAAKGGTWVQRAVLDGENLDDTFGFDVSLSEDGSILAVGASGQIGTVYTYAYNPGLNDYEPLGDPIKGVGSGSSFGHSVSLSEDGFRLVAGAPYNATNNLVLNGELRVFELEGDMWQQMGDTLTGDASLDWLGSAVDISGDGNLVIASAPRNRAKKGYVRTWTWDGDAWKKVGEDITNKVQPAYSSDRFGHSIALSVGSGGHPRVAIGSPWKTVDGRRDAGMTLVYEFIGNTWNQLGRPVTLKPAVSYTENGNAVDLDGGILVVGIPGAGDRGAVALYRFLDGDFVLRSKIIYGETVGDDFGVSLASRRDPATDGFALVVGALMGGNKGAGYVASYVKQDHIES